MAHSQKVKDSNDIARVGTISAGDPEIGRLIAEAGVDAVAEICAEEFGE